MEQNRIDDLEAAKATQLDGARPEAVERVHRSGRLTARERLGLLLDPGSEVEYGSIAARSSNGDWVAETGGVDIVGSIGGQPVIASSTDFTDKGGGYGAARLERLFGLAHEHRWPVVFFVDGGGSRARHPRTGRQDLELNGPFGRFQLFDGIAELSGWVPTIAIVSGPSFAGHASLAGFSDCVIATGGSSIGMGGPPMVEAALGLSLSANELAGVEMHELTGGIELLVHDEREAIDAAKQYLAYYQDQPADSSHTHAADTISSLVPDEGPYDMAAVIAALVDDGTLFQLRPRFSPSIITGLARMDGRSVGVIANQPMIANGTIDEQAATKVARFVELCDAYEYPIVSLIDTPGCVVSTKASTAQPGSAGEKARTQPGMNRWHSRAIMAHHHRTVPLFAVQIRRGGGIGPAVIAGLGSGRSVPALWLAWPTTELGKADGFAAVRHQDAYDDVVSPLETRERISRLLGKMAWRTTRAAKKHPIDTW